MSSKVRQNTFESCFSSSIRGLFLSSLSFLSFSQFPRPRFHFTHFTKIFPKMPINEGLGESSKPTQNIPRFDTMNMKVIGITLPSNLYCPIGSLTLIFCKMGRSHSNAPKPRMKKIFVASTSPLSCTCYTFYFNIFHDRVYIKFTLSFWEKNHHWCLTPSEIFCP